MTSNSPAQADKYQMLAERFDQRANRLHKQANFLLIIVIVVLAFGAAGFLFANNIASFTLGHQTAQDQYARATAAVKQNEDQRVTIQTQISTLDNNSPVTKPFNDKINTTLSDLGSFENTTLEKCPHITHRDDYTIDPDNSNLIQNLNSSS